MTYLLPGGHATAHYRDLCLRKHQALTTKGQGWPGSDPATDWMAGSIPAARELASMARVYAADVPTDPSRTAAHERIWARDDAIFLLRDLVQRAAACRLYDASQLLELLRTAEQSLAPGGA